MFCVNVVFARLYFDGIAAFFLYRAEAAVFSRMEEKRRQFELLKLIINCALVI